MAKTFTAEQVEYERRQSLRTLAFHRKLAASLGVSLDAYYRQRPQSVDYRYLEQREVAS